VLAVGLLGLALVGLPALGALVLVSTFDGWYPALESLGPVTGVAALVPLAAVLAGLSLVPTHAVSLVAGMLAGAGAGVPLALLAVALAALFGHGLLRRLVGERLVAALASRPRAAAVHAALLSRRERLVGLIVLLRLSPVMPFAGTNLVFAAAGVTTGPFLLGSVVGLAPRVALVAVAGAGLSELDLSQAGDSRLAVVGAVATVLSLVLLGRVSRRALAEALGQPTGPA